MVLLLHVSAFCPLWLFTSPYMVTNNNRKNRDISLKLPWRWPKKAETCSTTTCFYILLPFVLQPLRLSQPDHPKVNASSFQFFTFSTFISLHTSSRQLIVCLPVRWPPIGFLSNTSFCITVHNYSAVVGIYTVTCLTARNMNNLNFHTIYVSCFWMIKSLILVALIVRGNT